MDSFTLARQADADRSNSPSLEAVETRRVFLKGSLELVMLFIVCYTKE
jgi:hypothetical protein